MLKDIGETSETVTIEPAEEAAASGERKLLLRGVSLKGCRYLLMKFPDLGRAFSGNLPAEFDTWGFLISLAPEIIAAGIGKPGDETEIAFAESLPALKQLELLNAIKAMTAPEGLGPFALAILTAMRPFLQPAPSDGKSNPAGDSPDSSKDSSPPDTTSAESGK